MASKYQALKSKLDPFTQPPDFQARVDEIKTSYIGLEAAELARAFAQLRKEKQEHEAEIKLLNAELEALSQLLIENLEALQLQKLQLNTGETIYLDMTPYCSVTDKEKVMAYIKKHKLQSLLSIHFQTLNAMIKEMLINGKPAPDGVAVYMKTSARLRGGNNHEEA